MDASAVIRWLPENESHLNAEEVLEYVIDTPGHFALSGLPGFKVFAIIHRLHPNAHNKFTPLTGTNFALFKPILDMKKDSQFKHDRRTGRR